MDRFVRQFQVHRSDASARARQYLQGLMQADRKNKERMEEVVPQTNSQALQQFLSDSPWDAQDVMDEVALRASELIGDPEEAYLILDETSFRKKGKNRGGLPQSWSSDKARCAAAKIPVEEKDFRTKDSLALSQVCRARGLGVKLGWVLADVGNGKGPDFLLKLDAMGERFLVDVHKNFVVHRGHPRPRIPRRRLPRGKAPIRARSQAIPIEVRDLVARQGDAAWKRRTLRQGTQEVVTYECLRMPVWIWEKGTKKSLLCQLIMRKESNGEIKYSLSNAKRVLAAIGEGPRAALLD